MVRPFLINGKFLRAPMTGVHRVAHELANALGDLVEKGHEAVTGMVFEIAVPAEAAVRATDIRLPARILTPLSSIPWEQLTLPMRKGRGTLVNLCNIGPLLSADAVTMVHDVQVRLSPRSYRAAFRAWYGLVQPVLARRNRQILTVSHFSKGQIVESGLCPAEKIAVIHNGADHILRTEASAVKVVDRDERRLFVVALSTVQAHKNIAVLLRAFGHTNLEAVDLVLIGGDGRDAFTAAGLALPGNVHFTGRVSDGGLRWLMEHALCLAFPSTTEGFGLPPLEAMAVGCPTVVAPCGALPEVCGEASCYVDPNDDHAWAEAISRLAGDEKLRDDLRQRGLIQVARFTWREAAITLAKTLQRLE